MKKLNQKLKYGAVAVFTALPTLAMAEGLDDVGTTITTEINKIVPIVSSVGVALLSVYVLMKCFKLVSSFATGRS